MQSVTHGLRSAAIARRSPLALVQPHQIASSSRVQWDARRTAWNPMAWFRKDDPTTTVRRKADPVEVQKAKEQLKEEGKANLFETLQTPLLRQQKKEKATAHKYSTGTIRMSHRKLNDLARQIAQKPVDLAIMQMAFSEKRVSNRLKSMLTLARKQAMDKGLNIDKLVVSEAWVNKGQTMKRIEIKGRGKTGIRKKRAARMHVVLKEGLTAVQAKRKEQERKLRKIISAGMVREDKPLRNPAPTWAW